jgi:Mor family transcriptional regulator
VTITDKDKLWLEGYSKVHKISVAEAIRQGIGELKKAQQRQTYERLVEKTSGIWQRGDGLEYQREIRSEWD